VISPQAMADTLAALKRFYRSVQEFGADQVRAVATSAMRDARNARAFLAWVTRRDGVGRRDHLRPRRRAAHSSRGDEQ
jgi:exopolyphosphatase/guanosine-5'-triphosphate,3'-diphosphate pyrophosphatase